MSDLTLRWVVTFLFGVSTATYLCLLAAQRRRSTDTVNHVLHLAMSAAMILMAWDVGMNLPTLGTIIFFLLAAVWFARAAGRRSTATGGRLTNAYYAVMMTAMAWMFVVMNGGLPGQLGHPSDHAPSPALAMNMSNMSDTEMMPAHDMSPTGSGAEWITAMNWGAALGFAAVTLYWACHYVARRRRTPVPHFGRRAHLDLAHQVCSAAGTAVMFGSLL